MKSWMKWLIAGLVIIMLGIGGLKVLKGMKARAAMRAAATTTSTTPSGFDLTPADVVQVSQQELTRTLAVSGGLKAANTAFVKAKVAAELKSLLVREGDTVKAGQVIGQLDTSELELRLRQTEQSAASAKAQADIAKRTLENNRALVAQGFISATGLETSISNDAAAQANYGAASAAVELARKALADASLVSPISGMVSQRLAQPGERVSVDARVVEIVDLSRIELEAAMTPEDVVDVRVGHVARLQIDGFNEPMPAKVARINPSTQAGTRAVMVYLAVGTNPGLRQGLFAKGYIELQRRTAPVAPVTAVRIDQAKPYVLALENGKVVHQPVTLGMRGEATLSQGRESVVEITQGASVGTTLLRGSVGQVRDGTAVRLSTGSGPVAAPQGAAAAASLPTTKPATR